MLPIRPIENDGFAIIPGVLMEGEAAQIAEGLEHAPLPRSKAGIRHALRNGPVKALAFDPRLLVIAKNVLGSEATPFRATLFDKSHNANWLVVWHQDTALPLRERHDTPGWGPWSVKAGVLYAHAPAQALSKVLALRVHLDDSTEQNGPLRVLPGTHRLGVLSDNAIHELADQQKAVDCLAVAGGVVAMRPLLVHASSKSHNEARRRVLHIEYAASIRMSERLELAIA